jgi:hypothetical protein
VFSHPLIRIFAAMYGDETGSVDDGRRFGNRIDGWRITSSNGIFIVYKAIAHTKMSTTQYYFDRELRRLPIPVLMSESRQNLI